MGEFWAIDDFNIKTQHAKNSSSVSGGMNMVLWAPSIGSHGHSGTLRAAIIPFELDTSRETANMCLKMAQSFCSMIMRGLMLFIRSNIVWSPSPPSLLSGHCAVWLSLVSVDATQPLQYIFSKWSGCQKMGRRPHRVDAERRNILSAWYTAWKMAKGGRCKRQIFWLKRLFRFFCINKKILIKNGGYLVIHLI